ncbi:MAG: hypothetical protein GY799_17375, partial [Desulfobulbaceae bacterium]|nr:hypothetical protein [Desulfobulbaceae bacterium]
WVAGSPYYSCHVVDGEGNILYLLSRGESKAPGKNVVKILGWHDAMAYMIVLRQCIKNQRPAVTSYRLQGERCICAMVPMSADKVYSHRLRVYGDNDEALRTLIRLVFSDQMGFNRRI